MRWTMVLLMLLALGTGVSAQDAGEVSIYCSLDQQFSEELLDLFSERTGIKVLKTFDTEATKTVGLVNKIISEEGNPRCDVYWNNEVGQTIRLKNKSLLQPYVSPNAATIPASFKSADGSWTGLAARARVIIYNKELFDAADMKKLGLPSSLDDLKDRKWAGKLTMAKPLTGTTLTHAGALFASWGETEAKKWIDDLRANDIYWSRGNAMVMRDVGAGRYAWGYTDTDDANVSKLKGHPTDVIIPDQGEGQRGTLVIPNSVMIIKNAKNLDNAKKLVDFILSNEVEEKLAAGRSAQIPLHPGVKVPAGGLTLASIKAMPVDWEAVGKNISAHGDYLHTTFENEGEGRTWPWVLGSILVVAVFITLGKRSAV
ncbi:MAG: iron(III) transport system substrate-binding protein [Planctomycetota bacterium]|jgi:iron(III) transport system substrate-binding protein